MEWRCSAIQIDVIAFSGSICYIQVHNTKGIECVIRGSLSPSGSGFYDLSKSSSRKCIYGSCRTVSDPL